VNNVDRVRTGITGLDDLIEGGFPAGRSTLISGACGTGKTIFSMQYIYQGAKKYSEPGIYVTLDERPDFIRQDVLRFGWDLRKLEDENIIHIIDGSIAKIGLPALGFNFENDNEIRNAILIISYLLMRTGVTSLLTSEAQEGENRFGKYGVEEYVVDGVVVLHYMGIGTQSNRTLHIRKMRATKHSEDLHPIKITNKGMVVRKIEESYEET